MKSKKKSKAQSKRTPEMFVAVSCLNHGRLWGCVKMRNLHRYVNNVNFHTQPAQRPYRFPRTQHTHTQHTRTHTHAHTHTHFECGLKLWPFIFGTEVYSTEKMADIFSYESSEIDWCEDNYKHSEQVVESFNTVSPTSVLQRSKLSVKTHLLVHWPMSPTDEQLHFLHYSSHHALPSAPLCQREEPGYSPGLDHDDICRSVTLICTSFTNFRIFFTNKSPFKASISDMRYYNWRIRVVHH